MKETAFVVKLFYLQNRYNILLLVKCYKLVYQIYIPFQLRPLLELKKVLFRSNFEQKLQLLKSQISTVHPGKPN